VAGVVADSIGLTGNVQSLNQLFAQIQKVTAQDVQRMARQTFQPKNETVVTLSHKAAAPASRPSGAAAAPQGGAQ
jgi:predicted Zn-dependent peptidase